MIPIRVQVRGAHRVILVWVLGIICIAVLVRLATLPDERAMEIMLALAVVPARLLGEPWYSGQALTLLTSCFLHAGWVHLLGNMLFLAVFGPPVESRLGWWRFGALFAFAGAVGALAHVWTHPDSLVPLVGASGAIAGVLGAHLVLEPKAKVTTLVPAFVTIEVASLPAGFVIALWFALQLASNVASVTSQTPVDSVAWTAHIAGFAAGMLAALPARLWPKRNGGKKRRA